MVVTDSLLPSVPDRSRISSAISSRPSGPSSTRRADSMRPSSARVVRNG